MKFFTVKLKTLLSAGAILAAFIVALVAADLTGAVEVYSSTNRFLPIYCVGREDNRIAISFDCAWGVEHTDDILKNLEEGNVKATFFTVEFWAKEHPDYLKKVSDAGHEIGTHSATHSYMSRLSESEIKGELRSSADAITAVTGKTVELFRPPFGDYDDLLIDTANAMGLYPIQWDVDSLDWKDLTASDIAERVISRVKSGSIILCHNNGLHTAEALPIIIDTLKAKGFTFVPIGELIYRENYTIDATGKQIAQNET